MMPRSLKYGIFSVTPRKVPGMGDPGRRAHGEASHVRLVDRAEAQGSRQRPVPLPVEIIVDDDALGHARDASGERTFQVKFPVTAFTYGSKRSLSGLKR